jgi:ankyrin repeat protein
MSRVGLTNTKRNAEQQQELPGSLLHYAAQHGDTPLVRELLAANMDVDTRDGDQNTPLHFAAANGNTAVITALLDANADINAQTYLQWTSLHAAAYHGQTDVITTLLAANANNDARDVHRWTPLHVAVLRGHTEAALLLAATADIHAEQEQGATPLHLAAQDGNNSLVKALLAANADVHRRTHDQRTPLHFAADTGDIEVVLSLLAAGADVNSRKKTDQTPLHLAAKAGHDAVVATLVTAQAEINARDNSQWTPLHYAAENGYTATATAFIAASADIDVQERHGATPLHLAAQNGHTAVLATLLDANAMVDIQDKHGRTALHYAAYHGHTGVVKALLAANADVDAQEEYGQSPLNLALKNRHVVTFKALLMAKDELDLQDEPSTAQGKSVDTIYSLLARSPKLRKYLQKHLRTEPGQWSVIPPVPEELMKRAPGGKSSRSLKPSSPLASMEVQPQETTFPSPPMPSTQQAGVVMCQNCLDLDLEAAFEGRPLAHDDIIPSKSSPSAKWVWKQSDGCSFCQFLANCVELSNPQYLHLLRSIKSTKKDFDPKNPEHVLELVFLASNDKVRPEYKNLSSDLYIGRVGQHLPKPSDIFGRSAGPFRIISPRTDGVFDLIRNQIKYCQNVHSDCTEDLDPLLARIRVLDCHTRRVIDAPDDCRYVALSYVWGDERYPSPKKDEIVQFLPQTVEDSVAATIRLGYRYLWVDMYCILQDDATDLHNQLRQMDRIYRGAQVTIIAAAGDNATFGLPGVSSPRRQQAYVNFNGIPLTTIPSDPWSEVKHSKWNSRGWTYQESLFSRRRIFFTKSQVIFNCCSEWNCESIFRPLQHTELKDKGIIAAPDIWQPNRQSWSIYQRITQYSDRKLSFEYDILNAFLGVLRAFERLEMPVLNHWGIPIIQGQGLLESFMFGLSWQSAGNSRREKFPSWSWVGWSGSISYHFPFTTGTQYLLPEDTSVAIELTNGTNISLAAFKESYPQGASFLWASTFLYLEAWTTEVYLQKEEHQTINVDGGTPIVFYYCEYCRKIVGEATATLGNEGSEILFHATIHFRYQTFKDFGRCIGILLGMVDENETHRTRSLPLVLVSERDGYWERIGTIPFDNVCHGRMLDPDIQSKLGGWGGCGLGIQKRKIRLG